MSISSELLLCTLSESKVQMTYERLFETLFRCKRGLFAYRTIAFDDIDQVPVKPRRAAERDCRAPLRVAASRL